MRETDASGATDIPRGQHISNEYDDYAQHVVVAISERTSAKDIAIRCVEMFLAGYRVGTLRRTLAIHGHDAPFRKVNVTADCWAQTQA